MPLDGRKQKQELSEHIAYVMTEFTREHHLPSPYLIYQPSKKLHKLATYQVDAKLLFSFSVEGFELRDHSNAFKLNYFEDCILNPLKRIQ